MEYLFSVYWKDYRIGFLFSRNKKYIFLYDKENLYEVSKEGFDRLIGFPDLNNIYISDSMFPIFSSRIKSKERQIRENLSGNSDFIDTLINTNGKLVTDNIKIIKESEIEICDKKLL